MAEYLLLHKNNPAARIRFDENSGTLLETVEIFDERYLPICAQNGHVSNLPYWWQNRAVPRSRSDIKKILTEENIKTTQCFLLDNLGLSMTDAFWVCPAGHDIGWEDVSFQTNLPMDRNIELPLSPRSPRMYANLTPLASTGGELRKLWTNIDGKLFLAKGNLSGYYFQQSLNEVLASMIHSRQGYGNFVPYRLMEFKDGSVGCACPCFTSDKIELVSAWEIFSKYEGKESSGSLLDDYASFASREGYDYQEVRDQLDYMFTIDFVMSNTDRHASNYGLIRHIDTLEAIGPAPLFDTGNSMFHLGGGIESFHDLFHTKVSSLYETDGEIMAKVRNPNLVDLSKLPAADEIISLLKEDPVVAPSAERLYGYMHFKTEIVRAMQAGLSLDDIERGVTEALGNDSERKDINKGWDKFWKAIDTSNIKHKGACTKEES